MATTRRVVVFAAAVGLFCACDASRALMRDQVPPAATFSISGQVVEAGATPRPFGGVPVSIAAPHLASPRVVFTDEGGRFSVADLTAGTYGVSAVRPPYVMRSRAFGSAAPATVALSSASPAATIPVTMDPGAVIAGVVTDDLGEPAARASVTAYAVSSLGGTRRLPSGGRVAAASTDARGRYRIYGLRAGRYVVAVGLNDGGRASEVASPAELDWAERQIAMGGRATGAPPPRSAAAIREMTSVPVFFGGATTLAEARLIDLAVGQELTSVDVRVPLVQAGHIVGSVVDANRTPLAQGVNVQLFPDQAIMTTAAVATQIAQDGTFRRTGLPPGQYRLIARVQGGGAAPRMASESVTVASGVATPVSLVAQPGVRVTGNIEGESGVAADVSGVAVELRRAGGTVRVAGLDQVQAAVDASGQFVFENVLPGSYDVRATAARRAGSAPRSLVAVRSGGRDVTDAAVAVAGESPVQLTVVLGSFASGIAGQVSDGAGRPSGAYFVAAFPVDPALWRSGSRRMRIVPSAQDGSYEIGDLPVGDYHVALVTTDVEQDVFDDAILKQAGPFATRVTVTRSGVTRADLRTAAPAPGAP